MRLSLTIMLPQGHPIDWCVSIPMSRTFSFRPSIKTVIVSPSWTETTCADSGPLKVGGSPSCGRRDPIGHRVNRHADHAHSASLTVFVIGSD